MQRLLVLTFLSALACSCLYQAPPEDHLHEVPTMNNPNITREQNHLGLPV